MSASHDLNANPETRDLNGVTLWEGLEALEAYERSEGRICTANLIRRAIGTLRRSTPMTAPRPFSEWTEEDGDVLWWRFPIEEPPYCGSPQDVGRTVEIAFRQHGEPESVRRFQVGGWPGYHTHWTPIPIVSDPA